MLTKFISFMSGFSLSECMKTHLQACTVRKFFGVTPLPPRPRPTLIAVFGCARGAKLLSHLPLFPETRKPN